VVDRQQLVAPPGPRGTVDARRGGSVRRTWLGNHGSRIRGRDRIARNAPALLADRGRGASRRRCLALAGRRGPRPIRYCRCSTRRSRGACWDWAHAWYGSRRAVVGTRATRSCRCMPHRPVASGLTWPGVRWRGHTGFSGRVAIDALALAAGAYLTFARFRPPVLTRCHDVLYSRVGLPPSIYMRTVGDRRYACVMSRQAISRRRAIQRLIAQSTTARRSPARTIKPPSQTAWLSFGRYGDRRAIKSVHRTSSQLCAHMWIGACYAEVCDFANRHFDVAANLVTPAVLADRSPSPRPGSAAGGIICSRM